MIANISDKINKDGKQWRSNPTKHVNRIIFLFCCDFHVLDSSLVYGGLLIVEIGTYVVESCVVLQ